MAESYRNMALFQFGLSRRWRPPLTEFDKPNSNHGYGTETPMLTDVAPASAGHRFKDWSPQQYDDFGRTIQVCQHTYHTLPLFEKDALIELLDKYPRDRLQAFTMGYDPTDSSDWHVVQVPQKLNGQQIWECVERGRFWLNLLALEKYSDDFGGLITGMYQHLNERCAHLNNPKTAFCTLLISSPGAQVYYHMDVECNMLWHLSGHKRIWVYPAMDTHFAPQELIEDIYSGEVDEELPFKREFDEHAEAFLLNPGDVASWPHNGPHRIENIDLNVSMSTSYNTPAVERRRRVQLANKYILRRLGFKSPSMSERGLLSRIKRRSFYVYEKVEEFFNKEEYKMNYVTNLRMDPDEPDCIERLAHTFDLQFRPLL